MALVALKTLLGVLLLLHLPIAMAQQVSVSGGRVSGLAMPDGSTIFYGIPYAAAPSGQRRWKPPAPRSPWTGMRDTSKQAPACVQADAGWNGALIRNASEDCLTNGLPVWPMVGERDGLLSIAPHGIAAEVGARAEVRDLMFQGGDYPPSVAVPS